MSGTNTRNGAKAVTGHAANEDSFDNLPGNNPVSLKQDGTLPQTRETVTVADIPLAECVVSQTQDPVSAEPKCRGLSVIYRSHRYHNVNV